VSSIWLFFVLCGGVIWFCGVVVGCGWFWWTGIFCSSCLPLSFLDVTQSAAGCFVSDSVALREMNGMLELWEIKW
jgi:hypothetical protein